VQARALDAAFVRKGTRSSMGPIQKASKSTHLLCLALLPLLLLLLLLPVHHRRCLPLLALAGTPLPPATLTGDGACRCCCRRRCILRLALPVPSRALRLLPRLCLRGGLAPARARTLHGMAGGARLIITHVALEERAQLRARDDALA
jgi:hypothetical protein